MNEPALHMPAGETGTMGARNGEFFRRLQQLTTQIHATRNVDEIMLDQSETICGLFGADRMTIYLVRCRRLPVSGSGPMSMT